MNGAVENENDANASFHMEHSSCFNDINCITSDFPTLEHSSSEQIVQIQNETNDIPFPVCPVSLQPAILLPSSPSHKLVGKFEHPQQSESKSERLQHLESKNDQHQLRDQQSLPEQDVDAEAIDERQGSDSGPCSVSEKRARRWRCREPVPTVVKDSVYWEKRRKNNESARKSREKRRMHDMVLVGLVNDLEDDNVRLRRELMNLKTKFHIQDNDDLSNTMATDYCLSKTFDLSPSFVDHNQSFQHNNLYQDGISKFRMTCSSPPPLIAMTEIPHIDATVKSVDSRIPHIISDTFSTQDDCFEISPPSFRMKNIPDHEEKMAGQRFYQNGCLISGNGGFTHENEVDFRERGNGGVQSLSSLQMQPSIEPLSWRISAGNSQFRHCSSPQITEVVHYPHFSVRLDQANNANQIHYVYDSHSQFHCSPSSSYASDDICDEPLELTVRHGSSVSNHRTDDNSSESDTSFVPGAKLAVSDNHHVSSFPHRLRHKGVFHDLAHPKGLYPSDLSNHVAARRGQGSVLANEIPPLYDASIPQAINKFLSQLTEKQPALFSHSNNKRGGNRKHSRDLKTSDPTYQERRRKNNEAARKCRENRKVLTKLHEAKSNHLEIENQELRTELTSLQIELSNLKEQIETKNSQENTKKGSLTN